LSSAEQLRGSRSESLRAVFNSDAFRGVAGSDQLKAAFNNSEALRAAFLSDKFRGAFTSAEQFRGAVESEALRSIRGTRNTE
jgi:hypothetical protein